MAIVDVNGYKLQTTTEMGEMACAFRSASSEGIDLAKIPEGATCILVPQF